MIVAGHAHACGEYLSADSIQKKLDGAGVDWVVLTPGEWNSKKTYSMKDRTQKDPAQDVVPTTNRQTRLLIPLTGAVGKLPQGNEQVYRLKQLLPERIRQCYWVTRENISNLEDDWRRMDFDGVKLHQCWQYEPIDSPLFQETARFAESHQLPLFIHLYSYQDAVALIAYLKAHPHLKDVIAHLFALELFLKESAGAFDNVWFDCSNCYFVSSERILRGGGIFEAVSSCWALIRPMASVHWN